MQVSVSSTGPLERQLSVQVPETQISQEVHNRLQSLAKTARIDGFRPGKAPMKLLERRYATRVREEVIGELLRRSFADAVTQEQLRPAGRPVFDPLIAAPGEGLSYTATFEIYPQIALNPIADLQLTKVTAEITDSDVDRMIETLRRQRRSWTQVERGAESGDKVTLDFRGTVEGKEYSGNSAEDFELELGAGRFIAGFEEAVIGKSVGIHRFSVSFPDDFYHKELAGRSADFEVNIKRVAEARLPALDAEFFQAFGVSNGSTETFRAAVRRNMERERDQAAGALLRRSALGALEKANPLQVPRALVDNEAQRMLEEMQRNLRLQGIPGERLGAMKSETFREQAERRVILGLLLAEIIEKNGLKPEPSRVRASIEQLAAAYDDPAAVIKWYYEDDRRLADVQMAVLEEQVVDWLLAQARVEEQRVSFDDLMKQRQTGEHSQANQGS